MKMRKLRNQFVCTCNIFLPKKNKFHKKHRTSTEKPLIHFGSEYRNFVIFPAWARNFSLLPSVHTFSEADQAPYSMSNGDFFLMGLGSGQDGKKTSHLQLVLKLRISVTKNVSLKVTHPIFTQQLYLL